MRRRPGFISYIYHWFRKSKAVSVYAVFIWLFHSMTAIGSALKLRPVVPVVGVCAFECIIGIDYDNIDHQAHGSCRFGIRNKDCVSRDKLCGSITCTYRAEVFDSCLLLLADKHARRYVRHPSGLIVNSCIVLNVCVQLVNPCYTQTDIKCANVIYS